MVISWSRCWCPSADGRAAVGVLGDPRAESVARPPQVASACREHHARGCVPRAIMKTAAGLEPHHVLPLRSVHVHQRTSRPRSLAEVAGGSVTQLRAGPPMHSRSDQGAADWCVIGDDELLVENLRMPVASLEVGRSCLRDGEIFAAGANWRPYSQRWTGSRPRGWPLSLFPQSCCVSSPRPPGCPDSATFRVAFLLEPRNGWESGI